MSGTRTSAGRPVPPTTTSPVGEASPAGRLQESLLGPRAPERIGARARERILEHQRSSELLVCWIQFCAIGFFGFVYALTPKAFPPSVPFEPVPVVLAVYAGVTAARLQLARTGRLTRPLRFASAMIDVAVLMVTIWSFHLQYGVPPATYLKAPTLLYVFILIALRTLRLDAGLIAATGISAMIGWTVLFGYALARSGPEAVTGDWALYMTSDRILIGAEVDKLLAIGAVTAVLSVAVERSRRLMIHATAERQAVDDLSRYFAPGVARAIRGSDLDLSQPGTRRHGGVLMVDLQGFSDLAARMSPEDAMQLLGAYHRRIVPMIHRHGGAIDKYLGDGILATFGVLRADERAAERGLAALADILVEGEAWRAARVRQGLPAPAICAAIDAGEVTMGTVGCDGRYEFTIIGDVVNRVAKLEKHGRLLGVQGVATTRAYEEAGRPELPGLTVRAASPAASGPAEGMALTVFAAEDREGKA